MRPVHRVSRVDPSYIATLARLPGADGQDLASELVSRFAGALPAKFERLRALVDADDSTTLAREAHSMRGTALLLGATAFASLTDRLETDARAADLTSAVAHLDALAEEWNATYPALLAACAAARSTRPSGPRATAD